MRRLTEEAARTEMEAKDEAQRQLSAAVKQISELQAHKAHLERASRAALQSVQVPID